ncbi:MAG: efflux RND transporter periplasmic adaptor subunit [Chlamydiota bacterium]
MRSLVALSGCTVLLALCLGPASCSQKGGGTVSSAAETRAQVEVTAVRSQKLSTTERLPAELLPYETVDIYAKETGFVKSIKVDRGSRVRQGELIAQLEAPELVAKRAQANAMYQSAESQLAAAQAKLAADQATFQHMSAAAKTPGVVAANDLDIAQKAAQSDAANVEALRKTADAAQAGMRAVAQLESYLNITAPFDGQLTTRYVHPGALVGPGGGAGAATPIVRIETLTRHRLVVPVPENDIAGVPEGTQVDFNVPSFPGKTFHAPIARISHDVDIKTRTMPVELDVRDPHAVLVPGTFCEVDWPVHRTYATLFVPASAVASNLERTFVIRVRHRRGEWVDVKTGASSGNLIEVFGDLHKGDEVVVHGTDQLRPGTELSPRVVSLR